MISSRRIVSTRPWPVSCCALVCFTLLGGTALAAEADDLEPPGPPQPEPNAAPPGAFGADAAPAAPAPSPTLPPAAFLPPAVPPQLAVATAPNAVNDGSSQNPSEVRVPRRIGVGLRLAYANPGGSAWADVPQREITEGMLRVQLDLDYPLLPNVVGGVYGALGIGVKGDGLSASCKQDGVSCSVFALDLGVQANILVMPTSTVDPWLGFAAGFDMLAVDVDYGSSSETSNIYGPAFTLSGGVDIDVGPALLGPYVAYQLGWYKWGNTSGAGYSSEEGDVEHVSQHSWLTIGLRGSFSLN